MKFHLQTEAWQVTICWSPLRTPADYYLSCLGNIICQAYSSSKLVFGFDIFLSKHVKILRWIYTWNWKTNSN